MDYWFKVGNGGLGVKGGGNFLVVSIFNCIKGKFGLVKDICLLGIYI